jgi:5'-3' exonuclease
MGVPGFVAWLYHNHKKTNFIFKNIYKTAEHSDINDLRVMSIENLFIDANCLIHPTCFKILAEESEKPNINFNGVTHR